MKTRVTMTLDPEIHASAKKLARQRGTNVSGLMTSLVRDAQAKTEPTFAEEWTGKMVLHERPGDPRWEYLKKKHGL